MCSRRSVRPTRPTRGSSFTVQVETSELGPHRSELVHREYRAILPDPRLPIEERPTVAEQVDDRDGRNYDDQRRQADQRNHAVEESLGTRVDRAMNLVDVEQERDAFELGYRQLAQPLVVEERHGTNPDPLRVQQGRLGHERIALLCLAVKHEQVGAVCFKEGHERFGLVGSWHHFVGPHRGDELNGPFSSACSLASKPVCFLARSHGDHSILARLVSLCCARQAGDQDEYREEDRGTDEDYEPRKQLRTGEQLQHRDDAVSDPQSCKRPAGAAKGRPGRVRQASRVARQPDQPDEDQDPLEPRFLGQRVGSGRDVLRVNHCGSQNNDYRERGNEPLDRASHR